MFRGIKNIIIILLIGMVASRMPIYTSNININALMPNVFSDKNIVTVTSEQNIISPNHVQIRLGFSPKSKTNYFNFYFDESEPFIIELSSNNKQIVGLSLDKLISSGNYSAMEFYNNDVKYITFEFKQKELNLPDGSYDLKITPNIKDKKIDIVNCEFRIDFNTEGNYVQAISTVKSGKMALTLYFPDNEFNHLIPITRIVKANTYPLTTIIRNMEQGPKKDLGLPTISPIPIGGSVGKTKNIAHVRLPRDISEFDHGSVKASIAINSFVKSLTSVDGISKVQFYLTGQHSNDSFHGIDINKPFYPLKNNVEIYTAYVTDTNRFLLEPIPFDMFDRQDNNNGSNDKGNGSRNNIRKIFNAMKFNVIPKIYNTKRHPIIPDGVELIEYNIDNGTLVLVFNEHFINVYKDNPNRHRMMVDGIAFTFMSLKNINSINIKIKPDSANSGSQQLMDYDFSVPLYINPEEG